MMDVAFFRYRDVQTSPQVIAAGAGNPVCDDQFSVSGTKTSQRLLD
jgi:hypothetical protein